MLVYPNAICIAFSTRFTNDFAARGGIVPLLDIDANKVEKSIESFHNSANVVYIVECILARRGYQLILLMTLEQSDLPVE